MVNEKKKKDDELSSILIACGIFTVTLLIVDFTYGNMRALLDSWVKWPFVFLHLIIGIIWVIVIKEMDDPNYDIYRKWLLVATLAALLVVLAHRAGYIDKAMFDEEVEKNKKEQTRNDIRITDRPTISCVI